MSLWLRNDPLLLASKSAVRRALIEAVGIATEVEPARLDERAVEAHHRPGDAGEAALLLAREKALAVSRRRPGRLVVGADQTLALGTERLDKPPDRAAAAAQLRRLRGRTHLLHSAVAVAEDGAVRFAHLATAELTMRAFSEHFLALYLDAAGDAVLHSVGAYQFEGLGAHLFARVDGDHATILGLPLLPLLDYLRRCKALPD